MTSLAIELAQHMAAVRSKRCSVSVSLESERHDIPSWGYACQHGLRHVHLQYVEGKHVLREA